MGCVLPAELLSRNRERNWCPGLSPVARLEQEGGVLAWPAHCPTEGAGNKVERANLLEACAGRKLCPLLRAVAGSIEAHSIGCPSMLLIHKVYCNRSEWEGCCTHPGLPPIVRRIDDRGNSSLCESIRKNDGKNADRCREKCG